VNVIGDVDPGGWEQWLDAADIAVQLRDVVTGETSAAVLEALSAGVPVLTNIASAAEWPEGTVALVASADPREVAAAIRALVADASALQRLAAGGIAFASAHQFERLARELIAVVGA
jgi:glycosyltransferase involved in cell wall biosynthesis